MSDRVIMTKEETKVSLLVRTDKFIYRVESSCLCRPKDGNSYGYAKWMLWTGCAWVSMNYSNVYVEGDDLVQVAVRFREKVEEFFHGPVGEYKTSEGMIFRDRDFIAWVKADIDTYLDNPVGTPGNEVKYTATFSTLTKDGWVEFERVRDRAVVLAGEYTYRHDDTDVNVARGVYKTYKEFML